MFCLKENHLQKKLSTCYSFQVIFPPALLMVFILPNLFGLLAVVPNTVIFLLDTKLWKKDCFPKATSRIVCLLRSKSFMTDIMILLGNTMWAYRTCWNTAVSWIKIKLPSITLIRFNYLGFCIGVVSFIVCTAAEF